MKCQISQQISMITSVAKSWNLLRKPGVLTLNFFKGKCIENKVIANFEHHAQEFFQIINVIFFLLFSILH